MDLKSRNKVSPNFNMSSMTDIVFLLLIFFMLTSTLVTQNALDLLLPKSSSKNTEKQSVSVSIDKDINYYIDDSIKVSVSQLEARLKNRLNGVNDKGIVLYADKTVDIEYVVEVMDIAYRNQYNLVLATTQKE